MKNENIIIKNAKVHNLKGVDVEIPRNKFVVITGLSGSGKSSLAFDTLYAEGQRRYVESLGSYVRQFLGRMNKPEVDFIKGIPPAIAIEQKVINNNPRSTVGTTTEIYEYLKILFARIGHTFSPISGDEVKRHTVDDVIDFITTQPEGTHILLLTEKKFPEKIKSAAFSDMLKMFVSQGFSRMFCGGNLCKISDLINDVSLFKLPAYLVVDRVKASKSNELVNIINTFREEEGKAELQHKDFMKKIRKEIDTLETLGLRGQRNFSLAKYSDKQGKKRDCFELTHDGMLEMLNSESAYCRYKTIEYINKLQSQIEQPKKATCIEDLIIAQAQSVKALKKDSSIEEGTYPLKRSSVFNLPIQCNKC